MAKAYVVPLALGLVKTFVYTYELITWPIYAIFRKTISYMPLPNPNITIDVKYDPEERRTLSLSTRHGDPSSPWRSVEAMDGLLTQPLTGLATGGDIWIRSIQLYPNNDAFGTREVLKTEYETTATGRQFIKLTLGKYVWETFAAAELRVSRLSAALFKMLGGASAEKVPMAIYSETRAEWLYACQAAYRLGRPLVTLYSTLGEEALVHGLNETETTVLFVSDELLEKIPNVVKNCPSVKFVIFFSNGVFFYQSNEINSDARLCDSSRKGLAKARAAISGDVEIIDIVDVELAGRDLLANQNERPSSDNGYEGFWMPPAEMRPSADDLAIIMYTSGSTGMPKGVELTHKCLTSAVAGFVSRLPVLRACEDMYIGYLPLAHVFEMACEITCLFMGVQIGYGSPQTLTDTSTRIKKGACKGDLTVLKPTLFASVPTVIQRISKAVWEKVAHDGPLAHALFKFAYDYKLRRMQSGYPSFIVDQLVFRRVRSLMGGRVRYIISGGAPLSEAQQLFTNACFAPIIQGYGLTETFSSGALMETGDLRCNIVGAPVSTVEIQLREWVEGGYSPHDKPNPRGEVLIGGAPISRGYYKQPELTAKEFFTDASGRRWFCTGDIGMIHADGCLSIIDRKKDLVKLQAGEYVSLSKVELALSQSIYVETICVYARPDQNFTICFVSPKPKQLSELATKLNVMPSKEEITKRSKQDETVENKALHSLLCENKKINEALLTDLKAEGKNARLQTFEFPQRLHLDPVAWTPETGLVTDALKLKRFNIQAKFQSTIESMYRSSAGDDS